MSRIVEPFTIAKGPPRRAPLPCGIDAHIRAGTKSDPRRGGGPDRGGVAGPCRRDGGVYRARDDLTVAEELQMFLADAPPALRTPELGPSVSAGSTASRSAGMSSCRDPGGHHGTGGALRVGGLNYIGLFTPTRTPNMTTHVLHEFWTGAAASDSCAEKRETVEREIPAWEVHQGPIPPDPAPPPRSGGVRSSRSSGDQ